MPLVGQNKEDNWDLSVDPEFHRAGPNRAAEAMQRLRQSQDACLVMRTGVTHHNAPDSGCKVPVALRNGVITRPSK